MKVKYWQIQTYRIDDHIHERLWHEISLRLVHDPHVRVNEIADRLDLAFQHRIHWPEVFPSLKYTEQLYLACWVTTQYPRVITSDPMSRGLPVPEIHRTTLLSMLGNHPIPQGYNIGSNEPRSSLPYNTQNNYYLARWVTTSIIPECLYKWVTTPPPCIISDPVRRDLPFSVSTCWVTTSIIPECLYKWVTTPPPALYRIHWEEIYHSLYLHVG